MRFNTAHIVLNFQKPRFLWTKVEQGPPDVILGITEAYKKDSNKNKINLGVGAYRDDNGRPFVLSSVWKAELKLQKENLDKEYLGILGDQKFVGLSKQLAFDDSLDLDLVASTQTISGTGALRIGGEFLKKFYDKEIYIPSPTWGNHKAIFEASKLKVRTYSYYDKKNICLDSNGMLNDINNMEDGSVILLHACAHNPTGIDPTMDQWKEISKLTKKKNMLVFFDMAYQGFASGNVSKDAMSLRQFINDKNRVMLAQSYAKNLGLYAERIGCLSIVTNSTEQREKVESQLKIIIRPMYSNPPVHGARIVAKVLGTPELKELWLKEVKSMADRIINMRQELHKKLTSLNNRNWDHITSQIGMFCYSGLTKNQVDMLVKDHHVYLTQDGRISMAGVSSKNIDYLAEAINQVIKE